MIKSHENYTIPIYAKNPYELEGYVSNLDKILIFLLQTRIRILSKVHLFLNQCYARPSVDLI